MSTEKWEPSASKSEWTAFEKANTSAVMRRVDFYRKRVGWTVEELCRRLDQLGWPVTVSTMNGMFGNKRQAISPSELLTLGRALSIAPAMLLLPLEANDPYPLYPDVTAEPLDALSFIGARWTEDGFDMPWLGDEESDDVARSVDPVMDLFAHRYSTDWFDILERRLLERPADLKSFIKTGEWFEFRDGLLGDGQGGEMGFVRLAVANQRLLNLRELRRSMASRGSRLPKISAALSEAIAERSHDNRTRVWAGVIADA